MFRLMRFLKRCHRGFGLFLGWNGNLGVGLGVWNVRFGALLVAFQVWWIWLSGFGLWSAGFKIKGFRSFGSRSHGRSSDPFMLSHMLPNAAFRFISGVNMGYSLSVETMN